MSAEDASGLSKSARKRANQKARAAEEEAAAPAPAAPEPKAKAKAKEAAAPAPAPEAKSKAKAKAKTQEAAPAPAAPKAEAKAKAKGKAKAEPTPVEEPPKAEAKKAASKPAAKAAGKAKAKAEPEEEVFVKVPELSYFEIDNGGGDAWEVSTGQSKKQSRQSEKQAEKKAVEAAAQKMGAIAARGNQYIPGLAPVEVQVANAKGGAKAKAKSAAQGPAAAAAAAAPAPTDNNVSVTIKVPEAKIGRIVGPKGANVNLIKEKTGVKTVDMSGEMCTIVGPPDAVALAEHAVRSLIEKGYMALAFDDFEEEGVPVHPSLFPDIIGPKGAIIQVIKKEAKVEVDIPATPKNPPAGKKYKVTLAGSKAGVTLGKEIISSIALYGHHPVTHPGMSHQEMEIEEWRYRYLIGSKGSEMRHIQNNYKVRVNIPRETSECQNVVIIGEPKDVERAVKYIEKVMYEADQPKGRGAPEASADDGYTEEPEEDWMGAYMYKRK